MIFKRFLIFVMIACLACASASAEMPVAQDSPVSLLEGDRKEAVRWVQQRLIELGFLNGSADGVYGPKTAAALRAFQEKHGLEGTGKADATTIQMLEQSAASYKSPKEIQQMLIDLGYLSGKADGKFGKQSVAALTLFQRVNGLEVTGERDEATMAKLFSGDTVVLSASLSSGDSGDAVVQLQTRLAELGFFTGTLDGTYGSDTTSAVKRFQQHLIEQGFGETYGVTASGTAAPVVQFLANVDWYSTYIRDVEPGVPDSEAQRIESRLSQLGYMDLPSDDTLDDYGIEALKLFKAQAGLDADGRADRVTIDALFAKDAPRAEKFAPHEIVGGSTGLAVRAVENALLEGGMMIKLPDGRYTNDVGKAVERLYKYLKGRKDPNAALFSDSKVLSIEAQEALTGGLLGYVADVGKKKNVAEATRVQRRLHSLYYLDKSGVDGLVGGDTKTAIKEFQDENGLEKTGIADEATQNVLFSSAAKFKPYPYRVEVSIERQKVEVYQLKANNRYELVQTFDCSTGKNNSTPRGIFLEAAPTNRWHYFKKFHCWAQYSFRIEGDILFHSVIFRSKNEKSLNRSSVNAIGDPASHGCVRLMVEDAKWLFENCERGSLVVVIN